MVYWHGTEITFICPSRSSVLFHGNSSTCNLNLDTLYLNLELLSGFGDDRYNIFCYNYRETKLKHSSSRCLFVPLVLYETIDSGWIYKCTKLCRKNNFAKNFRINNKIWTSFRPPPTKFNLFSLLIANNVNIIDNRSHNCNKICYNDHHQIHLVIPN
jgi:hypothetical protein